MGARRGEEKAAFNCPLKARFLEIFNSCQPCLAYLPRAKNTSGGACNDGHKDRKKTGRGGARIDTGGGTEGFTRCSQTHGALKLLTLICDPCQISNVLHFLVSFQLVQGCEFWKLDH